MTPGAHLPDGDASRHLLAEREREALAWLFRFSDWERGVGWNRDAAPEEAWKLGRTRALLDLAGAPDRRLRIVHVAGTKGKGSTIACLESIVRAAGWRTGAYTQPHLHQYRERIRLDSEPVDAARFCDGVDRLVGLVEQLKERHPDAGAPTTFELTTVLAMLLFEAARVDLAIAEVGLGGRLDATNALDTDVSVLTRIGRDHTQILGSSLAQIAQEKVAIARAGNPMLSAVQAPSVHAVVVEHCEQIGAPLRMVGPLRVRARQGLHGPALGRLHSGIRFAARLGLSESQEHIGLHQRQNAALAVAAAEALTPAGLPLTTDAVEAGLGEAWLPARLEIARLHPRVLVDAAHNVDSARALADEIRRWSLRPIWLVLGILRDKDAAAILRVLLPLADGAIVTAPTSPRALSADALEAQCRRVSGMVVEQAPSVGVALEWAMEKAGRDGAVVVAGSFATASEARAALGLGDVVTAAARRAWLRRGGLEG